MRGPVMCGLGVLLGLALAASVATAGSGRVTCPLHPGTPTGGDVQWAFTDSGRPAGSAVKSSYVHGRGTWTKGDGTGAACTTDSLKSQGSVRDLVLKVGGRSKLSKQVKQGGHSGVRLLLSVKVRASDDPSCAKAATGTITLFASYGSVHRDAMRIHFGAHCTGHNLSYRGSALHVYIARHGAQVK